jgi:hypothetical protein
VLAVGETVCREFGGDGIFYGTINAFRREGDTELYTVRYTDGDQEDLDLEEYNFAYALWLQQEAALTTTLFFALMSLLISYRWCALRAFLLSFCVS